MSCHRDRFLRSLSQCNKSIHSDEDLDEILELLKLEKAPQSDEKAQRRYYHINANYSIILDNDGCERVAKKGMKNKILLSKEKMFDVLQEKHLLLMHPGISVMQSALKDVYHNITQAIITSFVSTCEECQKKRAAPQKGVVVKPVRSSDFSSRAQIDLIDFQAISYEEYRWVLHYQDHFTKFSILRSLKRKTGEEVVENLIDIFTTIGCPKILQCDNGREFSNSLLHGLKSLWPQLEVIHGRPRHPQSQGSVERANCDIKQMISAWMIEEGSSNWPLGLKFVQMAKNSRHHRILNKSPFQAVFGTSPMDLKSFSSKIPSTEEVSLIKSHESSRMYPHSRFIIFSDA